MYILATTEPCSGITEDAPDFDIHTQQVVAGQHDECHIECNECNESEHTKLHHTHKASMNESTQNDQTQDGISPEDPLEVDDAEWIRGTNMGRGLDRMSRSRRRKLPVIIEEGRTRPSSLVIAAKFATEFNLAVRNHVPILPQWKNYKSKPNIIRDFIGKVGSRFDRDITSGPIKKACVFMMKKAVRQQRYRLKKQYFDPFPLHLVTKISPVKSMNNEEWNDLVVSWKEQKKMENCEKNKANRSQVQFHQATGSRSYEVHIDTLEDNEKYKDVPPNALDLFKEFHYSKKKGFTPAVQSAIVQMENKINEPVEDGQEPKTVTEAVFEVLNEKTKKNKFLHNVGFNNSPGRSRGANERELEAELAMERQTSNELRELVNTKRQQMDAMVKQMQEAEAARAAMAKQMEEAEAARAKHDEEMKKNQADTNALLLRLMSMIPQSHATW